MDREEDRLARIRNEAARVIASEPFVRSPVLSRLLDFLVERTVSGEPIKSYTIAVEGLGRSADESEEADTYARVAVGRLRRALSSYYQYQPAGDRLHIDKGTYEVRVGPSGPVLPGAGQAASNTAGRPSRVARVPLKWLAGFAMVIGIAVFVQNWWSKRIDPVWKGNDTPTVAVEAAISGTVPDVVRNDVEARRQDLTEALSRYLGLRVVEGMASEFVVKLHTEPSGESARVKASLMERSSQRIVWADDFGLSSGGGETSTDQIAASIASPAGALSSYLRRRGYTATTPRGCWLRFTAGVQTFNTLGDEVLAECALRWYRASPQRPTAAFLYGWTLTDRSVWESQKTRSVTLNEAIRVLRTAMTLNPDVAPLGLALTRAYAFKGDRALVLQTAKDAIQSGEHNRLVKGMAATMLVFWNDPSGEDILRSLQAGDGEKYPWEHVGLLLAAMMRSDAPAARPHILHLERNNTGQPLLLVLRAAYFGKTGNRAEAAAAIRNLHSDPRILIAGTDAVIGKLPIAPEVRRRLGEWVGSAR